MSELQLNFKDLEFIQDLNKILVKKIEFVEKLVNDKSNYTVDNGVITEIVILKERIEDLPNSISNLQNLKGLSIQSAIKNIPDSIGKLRNLECFSIDSRYVPDSPFSLKSLPDSIGNLKKLRTLSIRGTDIATLPNTIGNLQNLYWINIHDKLEFLPESIGNCKNLRYLLLEYNPKIRDLPLSLKNLNLKKLTFSRSNWRKFSSQSKEVVNTLKAKGCEIVKGFDS